jgi:hypothetical protein
MADRSHFIPSYRRHKQSGQGVVTLPDGLGGRHDVLLGKHGTKASRVEYTLVIAEWEAGGRGRPPTALTADLTVNELILGFWKHAEQHYRHPDGAPTSELTEYRYSLKPIREMYGHTAACKFGPLALKAGSSARSSGRSAKNWSRRPPFRRSRRWPGWPKGAARRVRPSRSGRCQRNASGSSCRTYCRRWRR